MWSTLFGNRGISPECIRATVDVEHKYPPPVRHHFPKPRSISKSKAQQQIDEPTCICTQLPFSLWVDPDIGHIRTTDLSITRIMGVSRQTIQLLQQGPGFRPNPPLPEIHRTMTTVFESIEAALRRLAAYTSEFNERDDFKAIQRHTHKIKSYWFNRLRSETRRRCGNHHDPISDIDHRLLKQDMATIDEHFDMPIIDKAPRNLSLICKYFNAWCTHQRLGASDEIQPLPPSAQDEDGVLSYLRATVIEELEHKVKAYEQLEKSSIANYMLLPKFIKILKASTTAEERRSLSMVRCVTRAHKAPTVRMGTLITSIAQAVRIQWMAHCEQRSADVLRFTGVKAVFYHRTDSVMTVLHTWSAERITDMFKGDYRRAFETPPHDGLANASTRKFRVALRHTKAHYLRINIDSGKHKWSTTAKQYSDKSGWFCIDLNKYAQLVSTHLSLCMVSYGGTVYRQQMGAPMGEKPSGYYSEDYVDIADYDNTNNLLSQGRISDLRQFELFFRVADDCCGANCPDMFNLLMEYSPRDPQGKLYLELKHENESPTEIVFCDARIKANPTTGVIMWYPYDKAEDMGSFGAQLNRYCHSQSALLPFTHRATLRGQLERMYHLSSNEHIFLNSAAFILLRLLVLKHKPHTLRIWCTDLHFYHPLYQQWQPTPHTERSLKVITGRLHHILFLAPPGSITGCLSPNIQAAVSCALMHDIDRRSGHRGCSVHHIAA